MVKCVTCGVEMEMKVFNGVETDVCPRCGGVWLDEGELEDLTGLDPESGRDLGCPECGIVMSRKLVLGVEIDLCESCGAVWLDPGELEKIARHPPPKGNMALFNYVRNELGPKYQRLMQN
ncbi:MAG: zf-TFIIB domain-containing protein [Candidatus Thermoplasmatota archaeon]|nr:zf-TFIIB domain-containing protein [Candidatus Thermoplasmatota archaeon]